MARYIVNNSRFKPFEFQEMMAPIMMAEEAHMNVESQLGELSQQAGVWEGLANQESDPLTYSMYKKYSDDLRSQAEQLSSQGLTPQTRGSLLDMHRRYSSEIVPIEAAFKRREEHMAAQRALEEKDPTFRHTRSASMTSLDDYLKNPSLDYRSISGNQLAAQVSAAAQNLAKDMRDNPTEYRQILGGQMFEAITRQGFSPEEIDAAIRGDQEANPILTDIVDNVLSSAGLEDFNDQTRAEMRSIASQGLYSAVGQNKVDTISNKAWDFAMQKELLRYKEGLNRAPEELPTRRPAWKPIPINMVDKQIVKDYGGDKFQKASSVVNEIFTTNRHGYTDEEIDKRRNDPNRSKQQPAATINESEGYRGFKKTQVFGAMSNYGTQVDNRSEKNKDLDALIDVMDNIGVDNLSDLRLGISLVEIMAGKTDNVYPLKLANTDLAMKSLEEDVTSSYSHGGKPIQKINKNGSLGGSLSEEDARKIFESSSTKTIAYDTRIDNFTLSHQGEQYAIQPELLFPQYAEDVDFLKTWNPRNVSKQDEEGNKRPFAEYFDDFSDYSRIYEDRLMNMEGSLLDTFQEVFNNLPKTQSATGQD